jgi:hypothetical protein
MKSIMSLLFVLLLFSTGAQATIDGKQVIHIHGFQPKALNPFFKDKDRLIDAREQGGTYLKGRVDHYIYYDSALRLSQNSNELYRQVKLLERNKTCIKGCYFATISTGDLVARYILSRLGQWGIDRNKFKVLLSLDFVGAGGGTEGADLIVGILQGNRASAWLKSQISKYFFGVQVNFASIVGIVYDLRPSVARRHATQANNVPRIRISGGKATPILSSVIRGKDDGVIPMHSTCGSARAESIQSCDRGIAVDGKLGSTSGPRSLRHNHFPILMAKDMGHTDSGQYRGLLVAVNRNKNFGHFKYDVSESTRTTGWWIFKKKYRTVKKSKSNQLMMQFLINEIED